MSVCGDGGVGRLFITAEPRGCVAAVRGKFYRKFHQLGWSLQPPTFIDIIYFENKTSEMFKYLWSRGQNPTSEREKLQKELFSFSKNVQYGFPHRPVGMDWDPHLELLVIITKPGMIRIFGQPGVELTGHLADKELSLVRVLFLPAQGRLVSLSR